MIFLPGSSKAAIHGRVVLGDRPCPNCEYNLVGLRTGGLCPECGTPIRVSQRRDGNMGDAPPAFLRAQALAAWMVVAGAGGVLLGVCGAVLLSALGKSMIGPCVLGIGAGGALAWGVGQLSRPRWVPPGAGVDTKREWRAARWMARLAVCAWPVAFLLLMFAGLRPGAPLSPVPAVYVVSGGIAFLLGSFGLLVVPAYAALLADWATDSDLAARLKVGMVTLLVTPIFLLLAGLFTPNAAWGLASFILTAVSWLLVLVGAGFSLLTLAQFASLCTWAVVNASSSIDRDARVSQRIVDRIGRPGANPGQAPPEPTPGPATGPRGHYVARGDHVDAFEIADDHPPSPGP